MSKEPMEFRQPRKSRPNKVALAMDEVFRYNRCTRDIKRSLRNDWREPEDKYPVLKRPNR